MRSAYPSSQSFFDATSDSIRAEDVHKCRTSASFSSLGDLFTNSSAKSDLFPNLRNTVLAPEEVCFPAKKKRECEERTSIWHEWGSGECQTENVAQESSSFSSDLSGPFGSKSAVSPSSSFPNLGSANISLVTEEFTFPARKKREGSSWREERASFQDWITSGAPKEFTVTKPAPIVGSITDMYLSQPCAKPSTLLTNSKCSPFSSLEAPKSVSDEVSFPARKKREGRSFWQDSSFDTTQSDWDTKTSPTENTTGVSSLADMYLKKAGSKSSSLFPKTTVGNMEEVVFPKRKNHADRNAWRDWTNTGYGDYEDETDPNSWSVDNSSRSTPSGSMKVDEVVHPQVYLPNCAGPFSINNSASGNFPASNSGLRGSQVVGQTTELRVCEAVSDLSNGLVRNVDDSVCFEASVGSKAGRFLHSAVLDDGDTSEAMYGFRKDVDNVQLMRFTNSSPEQSSGRHGKYPPPLRSLSRQGTLRVPHHMPWVQLQHVRTDGRCVLKEVKVTQPVVFQPIREEGRLVLQFIGQETSYTKGHAGKMFDASPATVEEATVPKYEYLNDSVTKKTDFEPTIETATEKRRFDVDQAAALAETERKKRSSKVWPFLGSPAEEKSETSESWPASVVPAELFAGQGIVVGPWPLYGVPPEKLPEEESGLVVRDAVAVDICGSKSFNLRDLCVMAEEIIASTDTRIPERERPLSPGRGFTQDRAPPWLLGKVSADDRNFGPRSWNNQFRSVVERLGQTGNVITIHKARETAPLRAHFQALPRTSSLRNGISGEGTLTRTRTIRSSSLAEFATLDNRKQEKLFVATLDSGLQEKILDAVRGRASDARLSLSICQGIVRDSVLSLATAHSFLRSLTMRSGIPGEPDPRFSNFPIAAASSCADGMGERHHEKNFWEQLPCVS